MVFWCIAWLSLWLLDPAAALAQSTQTCVQAQVGSETAYSCLNSDLARWAERAHGTPALNTLSATSPPSELGTFDRSATAERMGNAFGHSVIAQRPPPPVYVSPLLPRPP